jgi:hypothetical protein
LNRCWTRSAAAAAVAGTIAKVRNAVVANICPMRPLIERTFFLFSICRIHLKIQRIMLSQ